MESKSMSTIAIMGFGAILISVVFAYMGMGGVKENQKTNVNIKYAKLCTEFNKAYADKIKVEDSTANFTGDVGSYIVTFEYRTRKFLTFAPEKVDLELDEVTKYLIDQIPNAHECVQLILVRDEVSGSGCREQVKKSSKTSPILVKKPAPGSGSNTRPGDFPSGPGDPKR